MEDDRWKKGQGRDGNSFSARQDGQAMKEDTNCNRWRGDGKRWKERQGGDGNSISARQDMSTNMIWKKTLNTTDGRRKQKKNHYTKRDKTDKRWKKIRNAIDGEEIGRDGRRYKVEGDGNSFSAGRDRHDMEEDTKHNTTDGRRKWKKNHETKCKATQPHLFQPLLLR